MFDRIVAVNLKGMVMGCKHAIPADAGRRRRIDRQHRVRSRASSLAGCEPRTGRRRRGSCSSPGPLRGAVRAKGIRCNAVAPGLVLTPAVERLYTPEQLVESLALFPMPRLCLPEDVANAVLFLASDEAGYVNGTTLMVDGGASACEELGSRRTGRGGVGPTCWPSPGKGGLGWHSIRRSASLRRALPHHFRHVDPRAAALPAGARRSRWLHRGAGQNNQIIFGALLELLLIIADIGTAVVIVPIVRRQSEEGQSAT